MLQLRQLIESSCALAKGDAPSHAHIQWHNWVMHDRFYWISKNIPNTRKYYCRNSCESNCFVGVAEVIEPELV